MMHLVDPEPGPNVELERIRSMSCSAAIVWSCAGLDHGDGRSSCSDF